METLLASIVTVLDVVAQFRVLGKVGLFQNRSVAIQTHDDLDWLVSTGKASNSLIHQICEDMYPCRNDKRLCTMDGACENAWSLLRDLKPYATFASYLAIERAVSLVCNRTGQFQDTEVADSRHNVVGRTFSKSDTTCRLQCPLVPSCPSPEYVRSDRYRPDAVRTSFSTQQDFSKYTIAVLKQEGFHGNENYSRYWCVLSCRSEVYAGSAVLFHFLQSLGKLLVSFTIALFVFGLALSAKNRFKMLENPRRPFLYLNVASFYGQAHLLGVLFPKEHVWCNGDGSLALNSRDNAVLCILGTIFKEASILATPFALVWVCYVWWKTIRKLADMRSATPVSQREDQLFALTFFTIPWSSAIWQVVFSDQLYEGHPLTGSCSFLVQTSFKSSRETKLVLLAVSLMLSALLFLAHEPASPKAAAPVPNVQSPPESRTLAAPPSFHRQPVRMLRRLRLCFDWHGRGDPFRWWRQQQTSIIPVPNVQYFPPLRNAAVLFFRQALLPTSKVRSLSH